MITRFLLLGFLWGFLLVSPPLRGMTVLPLDLPQMTREAGRIFLGRCQVSLSELDEYRIPATFVRFQVLEGWKGVREGEEVLIKLYGSQREPLQVREGEKAIVPLRSMSVSRAVFREGEEYLLFLYPESSLGFTSPLGGGQGQFRVLTGPQGERRLINTLGNRFLKGLSLPADGGAVSLDEVRKRVRRFLGGE